MVSEKFVASLLFWGQSSAVSRGVSEKLPASLLVWGQSYGDLAGSWGSSACLGAEVPLFWSIIEASLRQKWQSYGESS